MLESQLHGDNAFVTLTYDDASLPMLSSGMSSLEPKHLQDWLKRLRSAVSPIRVRFYAVGEYGDDSFRPHYHAALFGFPSCRRGQTGLGSSRPGWDRCCVQCKLVGETWGKGKVFLGTLEISSAQYLAGYVTKKMTRSDDVRLDGRWPEFARMSLRPGIGRDFLHDAASAFLQFNLETSQSDVPVTLRHGGRELPLGRYLRREFRKLVGRDEKTPDQVVKELQEKMRPLREAAFDASRSFAEVVRESGEASVARFHARQRIFKGKRSL